jgi:hypothetical protein
MNNAIGAGLGFNSNVLPSSIVLPGLARNGLSVDSTGHIVLGDPLGVTGPANLLNAREIFMDGFELRLSQRNTSGFDDWFYSINNNDVTFQDTLTLQRAISMSVDFAGNTSIQMLNDRTQAGWKPPFLRIGDSGSVVDFGRVQYSAQSAMEITDNLPVHALAVFQNGNVGIQAQGAPDPGFKFHVQAANGDTQLMRVQKGAGNIRLLLDDAAAAYQFGDVTGFSGGMFLNLQGLGATIESSLGSVLALFPAGSYALGNVSGAIGNGSHFIIDDTTGIADLANTALTAAYSINNVPGVSGFFTTTDLKTVTVQGGIITSIV